MHKSLWGVLGCALVLATSGSALAAEPSITFDDPQVGPSVKQIELEGQGALVSLRLTVVAEAAQLRGIRGDINRQGQQLMGKRLTLFNDEWKCLEDEGVATCHGHLRVEARPNTTFELKIGDRSQRFKVRPLQRMRVDSPQRVLSRGAQRVKVKKREACASAVAEDLRLPAQAQRVEFASRYGVATGWLACDTGEVHALVFAAGRRKDLRYVVVPDGKVRVERRVNARWRELCARGVCRDERAHKHDARAWSRGWKGDEAMDAKATALLAAYHKAAQPPAPKGVKAKAGKKARASR